MEKRIFRSLFLTALVSVVFAVTVLLVIFFGAVNRQMRSTLKDDFGIAISLLNSEENDLTDIMSVVFNETGLRVTVVSPDFEILLDTAPNMPELSKSPDCVSIAQKADKLPIFGSLNLSDISLGVYYYADKTPSGDLLIISQADSGIFNITLRVSVLALILSVLLCVAAYFASKRITAKITAPIIGIADSDAVDVYPEFKPLAEKLNLQKTEINRQLARVEKEKNRLTTVIENMDEGLIVFDNNLRVIMINLSAARIISARFEPSDCIGKAVYEVCPEEKICNAVRDEEDLKLTVGGRYIQLHISHIISGGEQIGKIGLLLDITERSEIERIKQEFTANVSHELKTPMTSISGYAELIENGMAAEKDVSIFAGRIRRESARMLTLIGDIIKLSQLDESPDEELFSDVELLSVCRESASVLELSADKANVSLEVEGEEVTVRGSLTELGELVYNLADNAIRYNRPGGSVKITVGRENGNAVVSVADTGIGIPDEHIGRVFERFYRVDKSRSKETGGTGLGLAIVKHIAERHSARLEISSKPGVGTTIKVIFGSQEGTK